MVRRRSTVRFRKGAPRKPYANASVLCAESSEPRKNAIFSAAESEPSAACASDAVFPVTGRRSSLIATFDPWRAHPREGTLSLLRAFARGHLARRGGHLRLLKSRRCLRSPRTTPSVSPPARSCAPPSWRRSSRSPPGSMTSSVVTPGGPRPCASSAAPGTRTRRRSSSATRSTFGRSSLRFDSGNLVEVFRETAHPRRSQGRSGLGRIGPMLGLLATGKRFATENFRAACEVADAFARPAPALRRRCGCQR